MTARAQRRSFLNGWFLGCTFGALVAWVIVLGLGILSALTGCAVSQQQQAYVTGRASKELVDAAYTPWDEYVRERIGDCRTRLPPSEHTKSEFDACLGPALEHDRIVMPLLEAYHAAALALYVVLTAESTDDEVIKARREVARAAFDLVRKIPAVSEAIRRAQSAIEGK